MRKSQEKKITINNNNSNALFKKAEQSIDKINDMRELVIAYNKAKNDNKERLIKALYRKIEFLNDKFELMKIPKLEVVRDYVVLIECNDKDIHTAMIKHLLDKLKSGVQFNPYYGYAYCMCLRRLPDAYLKTNQQALVRCQLALSELCDKLTFISKETNHENQVLFDALIVTAQALNRAGVTDLNKETKEKLYNKMHGIYNGLCTQLANAVTKWKHGTKGNLKLVLQQMKNYLLFYNVNYVIQHLIRISSDQSWLSKYAERRKKLCKTLLKAIELPFKSIQQGKIGYGLLKDLRDIGENLQKAIHFKNVKLKWYEHAELIEKTVHQIIINRESISIKKLCGGLDTIEKLFAETALRRDYLTHSYVQKLLKLLHYFAFSQADQRQEIVDRLLIYYQQSNKKLAKKMPINLCTKTLIIDHLLLIANNEKDPLNFSVKQTLKNITQKDKTIKALYKTDQQSNLPQQRDTAKTLPVEFQLLTPSGALFELLENIQTQDSLVQIMFQGKIQCSGQEFEDAVQAYYDVPTFVLTEDKAWNNLIQRMPKKQVMFQDVCFSGKGKFSGLRQTGVYIRSNNDKQINPQVIKRNCLKRLQTVKGLHKELVTKFQEKKAGDLTRNELKNWFIQIKACDEAIELDENPTEKIQQLINEIRGRKLDIETDTNDSKMSFNY